MSRSWKNTKSDTRDFERWLSKGKRVYYVNNHATNLAGQFEPQTYSDAVCTGRNFITGDWMFGTTSAKSLLCEKKLISDRPIPGLRDLASPEPDCRDEGWAGLRRGETFRGAIHTDDIKQLQYEADQAKDRYRDDRKAGRRWGFGR